VVSKRILYFCPTNTRNEMDSFSYLSNADPGYIDALYQSYREDPESVEFGWQKFFEGFEFGQQSESGSDGTAEKPLFPVDATPDHVLKEINVLNMINLFRERGHLFT